MNAIMSQKYILNEILYWQCSAKCGKGVQNRHVFCGLFDGSAVLRVDDKRCDKETKYNDTKPCEVPPEKCPAQWYAGPWSEVSIIIRNNHRQ